MYAPLAAKTHPNVAVPQVSLPIPMGKVAAQTSIDMANARAQTAFDPARIEEVIRDGRIDNASRQKIVKTLQDDEVFADWKLKMTHWSREQQMRMSHLAVRRILEIAHRDGWDAQEAIEAAINLDLQSPLSLHWVAFVPVIMGQGDFDQVQRWGNAAMEHQIFGCYLQTELGHGTNVQALETLATYVPETDEFNIHSPTLTSTKWWAGGAGLTATHAIVQCQLIIHDKRHGPHLFFVPLRSVQDGSVFPGIVAGDIGPKTYGAFAGLDNGWVRFDNVRIPRSNMLAKNAKVKQGGEYVKPPSAKLSYGGMVFIRSQMIDRCGWMLSRAITIALRYSHVRRQFRDPSSTDENDQERSVLSYPSLNRRLLPLLANSYAYILAGRRMRALYEDMAAQLDQGNIELLADVHVASSSLKAYCTKQVVDGIEECRQALGGHGFLSYAGFNGIFPEQLPSVTYEGDNFVLFQQVGRAMLKLAGELKQDRSAKVTATTAFVRALHDADAIRFRAPTAAVEWLRPDVFASALNLRAARLVGDLQAELDAGRRFVDLSWECVEVGRSHAEVVVSTWFAEAVADDAQALGTAEVAWISKLVALNALMSLSRNITPLALPMGTSGAAGLAAYKPGQAILTAESVKALETAIRGLVEELLPQVIGLSDAFGWTDWELSSALGRKDGRVYEHLMALAEGNPLNHKLTSKQPGQYNWNPKAAHGKHVVEWYTQELRPLFSATAARSDTPVHGNGAKI
ncbi:acyl-CoA oxidase [Tilletiaria anomala UBC 951]|uniref:Acyl-coenzyme A oxidase n=1 Tax=Tilletiaria anomala (strain ATCC 24038 / CBS 436.72 / UBC 951) TaxID=1037660 RepID=A0A066VS27_TILAU|nr:acyl-CoA oxidase [Tilletiaria anomala UBC 951]KDN43088.1 acyl-CoA oxidase [Tilletiaria anomala UBC 951]